MDEKTTVLTYNRMAGRYAARQVTPLKQEIERFAAWISGEKLTLDVGCGPGQYAQRLTAQGLSVIPLDYSSGMLLQAQAAGVLRLLQADMKHLPFPCRQFDGCFICASLLHLPRTKAPAVLAEFRRLLRPPGIIYLALKEGQDSEWVPTKEGDRFFTYYQPEEVDRMLETAGFQIVDGWINPPGVGQKHRWINRFATLSASSPAQRPVV